MLAPPFGGTLKELFGVNGLALQLLREIPKKTSSLKTNRYFNGDLARSKYCLFQKEKPKPLRSADLTFR